MSYSGNFPSGESITFRTDALRITAPTEVQSIIDPSSSVNDPNRANNVKLQTLSPLPPTETPPTPTPRPVRLTRGAVVKRGAVGIMAQ